MFFKTATILSLALSACVQASPTTDKFVNVKQYEGLTVTRVVPALNGTLVWYARTNPTSPSDNLLNKRDPVCGDNAPMYCDNRNEAPMWQCHNLREGLSQFPNDWINRPENSVCWGDDGPDQCCAGWNSDNIGFHKGDLLSAVDKVYLMLLIILYIDKSNILKAMSAPCKPNSDRVSVKIDNVTLGGPAPFNCVSQCLSNRPGNC
jgi:hypothetical protein